jgi:hypothetical protein
MDGYMIEVKCDDVSLRIHAKNKMAQMALSGAATTLVEHDDGSPHLQTRMGDGDVEVLRTDIAKATYKKATALTNGNLTVTTTGGQKYQLHFRKKQNADFEALARELGATV